MPRPVANPPNPWLSTHVEYIDDIPDARLEVFEEDARTILAENDSPDIPFRWGVNPYRGCYHGCAYCYARPTHEYLGWGAGTDFERKIIIKRNAPQLLRTAFLRRGWQGERIAFSGVTDCYQPLEAAYKLTRGCLEVCLEFRNPVHVITKSALVARDADLLARLSRDADAVAILSIPFADDETGRQIEPYASRITKRFAALEQLSAAGVRTAVAVAPVIPGLNDRHIPEILTRARACGATRAFMTMVRLTKSVLPVFEQRLTEAVPLRAGAVLSAIRDIRGGAMNRTDFGERMRGEGPRWQAIEQLFGVHARRLGFELTRSDVYPWPGPDSSSRPSAPQSSPRPSAPDSSSRPSAPDSSSRPSAPDSSSRPSAPDSSSRPSAPDSSSRPSGPDSRPAATPFRVPTAQRSLFDD